jgi:hypothetical protein
LSKEKTVKNFEVGIIVMTRISVQGFTIDPVGAKDLDDAIWLEQTEDGWRLQISISDVAAFIPKDSSIDEEAYKKSFSQYFADRTEHIYPAVLAEVEMSLLANTQRPAITLEVPCTSSLEVEIDKAVFYESTLHILKNYSYQEVDECIALKETDKAQQEQRDKMLALWQIANKLLQKRSTTEVAAVFDLEQGIMSTEEGKIIEISTKNAFRSYLIVQECMILMNKLVAGALGKANQNALYRNHTATLVNTWTLEKADTFYTRSQYHTFLQKVSLEKDISLLFDRATYETVPRGHYGLNTLTYLQFTSPIRRYGDTVNHRIFKAVVLEGRDNPYQENKLAEMGKYLTEMVVRLSADIKRELTAEARNIAVTHLQTLTTFDELNALDVREFHRVVKVALSMETIPSVFEEVFLFRLLNTDTKRLRLKTLIYILFELDFNKKNQKWKDLVFPYMSNKGRPAQEWFDAAVARNGWKLHPIKEEIITSKSRVDGLDYQEWDITVEVTIQDQLTLNASANHTNKKVALNRAIFALLKKIYYFQKKYNYR